MRKGALRFMEGASIGFGAMAVMAILLHASDTAVVLFLGAILHLQAATYLREAPHAE